jgi:hypothetical protein
MTAVSTITEVIERLEQLADTLDRDDGVRWFNRLYLDVTRRVAAALEEGTAERPTFLERLDIVFAQDYFDAIDAAPGPRGDVPDDYPYHAWKPLFESRYRRDIAPIQFALAGMNAHINHDLALGIQEVCRTVGVEPRRGTPHYREYVGVNDFLAEVEQEVQLWLLTGALAELNRRFSPIDDVIAIWSLKKARETAWTHAQLLWELSDEGFLEREYRGVLDRSVGLAGRAFLLPVPFVEGPHSLVAPALMAGVR